MASVKAFFKAVKHVLREAFIRVAVGVFLFLFFICVAVSASLVTMFGKDTVLDSMK